MTRMRLALPLLGALLLALAAPSRAAEAPAPTAQPAATLSCEPGFRPFAHAAGD